MAGLLATALAAVIQPTAESRAEQMIEIGTDAAPVTVKLNDGSFASRYRLKTDENGDGWPGGVQYLLLFDMTVSFFRDRVRLDLQAGTGGSFESGWANTGATGDPELDFMLRRLSLTLRPIDGLDVTIGSMRPEYGAGGEDVAFDKNGYIMGYRAKVTIEKGELVITTGNVDVDDPSVFDRFDDLDEINYVQMMITRSIGEVVKASMEYSHYGGDNYARGAVKIDVSRWTKFLDTILIEDQVRLSADKPGNALAVGLSKKFKDLVAGRDIQAALSYLHRTGMEDYPLGDMAFDGHSIRVKASIPDLIPLGRGTDVGLFANYVQSISDFDQFRAEIGIQIRF